MTKEKHYIYRGRCDSGICEYHWEEFTISTSRPLVKGDQCHCPRCMFHAHITSNATTIWVEGTDAKEVQEVSLAMVEKTKQTRKSPGPWASGSFYLFVFMIVIVILSIAGHLLPVFTLPIILIGGVIALSVIGAFQMRQDEKLSEENFLKLMALSFKYLPWLRRRDSASAKKSQEKL